ncbi:hypothetical protein [Streptomyces sp. XC 2026]|uniref:hypothetical protein n=1 Tax=Streptomyces sp. XC 2026 TaxID=2782004 RepID=UPI0019035D24|nr:hypothetical protein [Streptomyces sp. XC 2026]QQN79755.1 hypothetical protein IPZ77_21760 [Streptomyces sp. XC 2026]QQN80637.1 hypothetical protein IPZ77_26895 [Streptomyces sp. XC 2026]
MTPSRCRACSRPLRRPARDGLGPVCRRRTTAPVLLVPVPDGTPGHVPGQTALPLVPHQPSLWSL